jgi:hypothetical protein
MVGQDHKYLEDHKYLVQIHRVGQNRIPALYMTICLVVFLLEIPYVHHIYLHMANPTN